jgi:hypothetical protein
MMRSVYPAGERTLTGWPEILHFVHETLGVRRLSGKPVTINQLRRWRRACGFPAIPGGVYIRGRRGLTRQLPLTTEFSVTAWVLSRDPNARLFSWRYSPERKSVPSPQGSTRSRPRRVVHGGGADVPVAYAAACTDRD